MQLRVDGEWSDLVFHVLAHVDLAGLAANLHAPAYVAWVTEHAGPAAPELAEDARVLAQLLSGSAQANALQPLAALFSDNTQAARAADVDLPSLLPNQVARPEWLTLLASAPQAAELLRCRALLELKRHAELPPTAASLPALHAALTTLLPCAPRLESCNLQLCRALTWHGRVFGADIYLGVPDPQLGVSAQHVAMQGAHEATVLELCERTAKAPLAERAIERIAVVVLSQRAAAAGLAAAYADWGERFGVRPEHSELAALQPSERALAQLVLSG